ncbi:hypothetical protein KDL01_09645 [Actinospica durhamensis]|uniref:Uncharacterized protein n=1 Tax=Actinospica durhamensis TaxID=1508375 RepID=A0A941ER04_9ACTN|nr:hypothetical protein [Actinospica durhamensis]MBR7833529.1 hypothetical protein [Actinospica durhamensis]
MSAQSELKQANEPVMTGTYQKSGTFLHSSAGAHAEKLMPVLEKYPVSQEEVDSRLPPKRVLNPSCFHPEETPTVVEQMNLDDDLAENLARQLRCQAVIQESFAAASIGNYFPLSTMFENCVLFIPSAKRFYDLNQEIVHKHFPEVETAVVNAFVVTANKRSYGTHSASGIALQIPSLVKKRLGFPTEYRSFHTALTPTPLDRQPFVIFEDAEEEAPNLQYAYEKILECGVDKEEKAAVDKALYLFLEGKLSEIDLPTVRDFMMAKYWEKRYADTPSPGYYCDSRVGDALVFDNYRAHGDCTLPGSPNDRLTIDFRCFNKVHYPAGMSGGLDFIVDPDERDYQIKRKRDSIEFLLLTLGYESIDEFLRLVFGARGTDEINPFELMTDLQFGVYNKSRYHLLDQNLDDHYERVERLYARIEQTGEYILPQSAKQRLEALAQ